MLTYACRLVALNDETVGRLTDRVWEGEVTFGAPHDLIHPVIPRVRVHYISLCSSQLLKEHGQGGIDLILTTETTLGPGGERLTELPLRFYGAPGGTAWKQRPLPIATCRNCIFRSHAIRLLDAAGIAWDSAIDSDSDGAVGATISAELAVAA